MLILISSKKLEKVKTLIAKAQHLKNIINFYGVSLFLQVGYLNWKMSPTSYQKIIYIINLSQGILFLEVML